MKTNKLYHGQSEAVKKDAEREPMKLLNTAQYDIIRKNWSKVMAGDCISWLEFNGESEEEQDRFFNWFCKQYNDTFIISI